METVDPSGEPIFLTRDEVLRIHDHQVGTFGGETGMRDVGLLDSAIAQPRQCYGGQYLHPDLASMAAAYLFHLVLNHPFVDGNKRTGAHAALIFLGMNGIDVDYPVDEAETLTMRVAAGEAEKSEVVALFARLLDGLRD